MKKHYFKSLLFGALITASTGTFVSCDYDDDIDDLNSRVTVVEGLISNLQTAMATGAMVTDATQDADGVWTITLTNGQSIKLESGGGAAVTVTENPDNIIITVNDQDFVLPKGAAAASLIYRPVFEDNMEVIKTMDPVNVQFQVSGAAIDDATLSAATIEVVDAYMLTTRAAEDLFGVAKGASVATVDGVNIVTIPVKANQGVETGKSYNVNVRIKAGSKEYVSNYFKVTIDAGFVFNNFNFDDNIKGKGGTFDAATHMWTMPALTTMEGVVDFGAFFENVPAGSHFGIGSANGASGDAVKALRNSIAEDGKFQWTQRPGQAFPDGFVVCVMNASDQILAQATFTYNDPLAGVDWVGIYDGKLGAHLELMGGDGAGYADYLTAGAHDINIPELFTKAKNGEHIISPQHDGGRFINELWTQYRAGLKEAGDLIFHDGETYTAGEEGKKFAACSKGVWFTSYQISVGSSNRRNLTDRPGDEGSDANVAWCGGNCNGELMWDGISGPGRVALGIDLNEQGHLITTANYKGWNMRIGFWAKYEYLYGEATIGGDALCWAWINRRCCPEGVNDQDIEDAKANG